MTFLPLSLDDIIALPWRLVIGIASEPARIVGKVIGKVKKVTQELEAERKSLEEKGEDKKGGE